LSCRILVFAKAPVAGKVKTRLIPALGPEGAARLAAKMLDHVLVEAGRAGVGPVELCTDPKPDDPVWNPYRDKADKLVSQGDGDLGARLERCARQASAHGKIIMIGSDCPELDRSRLRAAAEWLDQVDAVIHPAADGGYVLLGLGRFDPSLFADIAWSTGRVAEQTIDRIRSLSWSLHVGETLHDVDEPEDLERLSHVLAGL
jgi:uncharacterized protein